MAPVQTTKTNAAATRGATCGVCGKHLKRKYDLPRHMETHNKDKKLYRCHEPECTYAAIQKSNYETHRCTHTGEKKHKCPDLMEVTLKSGEVQIQDCCFATTDPASLTRHRKTQHGYQPRCKDPSLSPPEPKPMIRGKRYLPVHFKREDVPSSVDSSSSRPWPDNASTSSQSSTSSRSSSSSTYKCLRTRRDYKRYGFSCGE